ncbi:MAG TPA: hypothetical protein VK646_11330 [Actinomycetota bacterium]|nr:hypothetical protein [Actinomycetota bacterium]
MTIDTDWIEFRALMLSQKPPLRAVIRATGDPGFNSEELQITSDGLGGWLAEADGKFEVTFPHSTTVLEDGNLESDLLPVHYAGRFNRAKVMLDPRLMAYLEDSTGDYIDQREVAGRDGVAFRVVGLRRDTDDGMEVVVDRETGVVLEMKSVSEPVVRKWMLSLTVGKAVEPPEVVEPH